MKTKNAIIFITAIIMIAVFIPSLFGQEDSDSWKLAEYSGKLNNKKTYFLYYNSNGQSAITTSKNLIYLETMSVYTQYGRRHHKNLGVKSRKVTATLHILIIDINKGRYCLAVAIDNYKNDDITTTIIDPDKWEWKYPEEGTLGEYYIILARKIETSNTIKNLIKNI